jgi:hypothetical protein
MTSPYLGPEAAEPPSGCLLMIFPAGDEKEKLYITFSPFIQYFLEVKDGRREGGSGRDPPGSR